MKSLFILLAFMAPITLHASWQETPISGVWDLSKDRTLIVPSRVPSDVEVAQKAFEEAKRQIGSPETPAPFYRLRIGDSLILAIYGEPSSKRHVTIGANGSLHYLFLNSIQALGMTIPELRFAIQDQLQGHYKYPIILITPFKLAPL
jgi:protein involved in polysaccharide export with SLBB domain